MSFIPPQSPINLEAAKARVEEAEANARNYAATHPRRDNAPGTRPRRVLGRLRALLRARSAR